MSFPSKPATFELSPGRRLLKTVAPEVSDGFRGVTPEDKNYSEDYAWAIVLSRFVGRFVVSDWNTKPPHLVFNIWDFYASSHYIRMWSRDLQVREVGQSGPTLVESWEGIANRMIKNIIDPENEGERLVLIDFDGNEIYPRADVAVPEVRASAVRFFPDLDTAKSHGLTNSFSVEEIYKLISKESYTTDSPSTSARP